MTSWRYDCLTADIQRKENRAVVFSPVHNPFQQHFADFRRPERFDTESEGDYRFEVVNLYAVFVR